jgi:hypothetical protein
LAGRTCWRSLSSPLPVGIEGDIEVRGLLLSLILQKVCGTPAHHSGVETP